MAALTFIQGGPGWRRTWTRRLGEADGGGSITVLNGHARDYAVRDNAGAFSIKWMPRGRAVYRVDGASHPLSGERAVILNQAQPYELEFLDRSGTESLCVFFSDDLVGEAWRALARPDLADDPEPAGLLDMPVFPDLVFRPPEATRALLAALRAGYGAADPGALAAEERLLGLLSRLVAAAQAHRELAGRIPALKPTTRRLLAARLEQARELIEDAPGAEPSLDALARASGVSKFHLLRLFKAGYGLSPSAYARRMRIGRAKALLRSSAMTTAEAAARSGYESESAFVRAFRRETGMTPGAFRTA